LSYLTERYPSELGANAERAYVALMKLLLFNPPRMVSLQRSMISTFGALAKVHQYIIDISHM
jgi:hypothetical protein